MKFTKEELAGIEAKNQPSRRRIDCPDGKPGCCVLHYSSDLFDTPEKKEIRMLVAALRERDEVIEKKNEALRFYSTHSPRSGPDGYWEIHISPGMGGEDRFGTRAREALAIGQDSVGGE